ncbi:MAG: FHA domain-containing protein [Actinobacteria bacterium]|nr:MAG: FHA domain-containing protein [Actinomycetota bacterium]
MARCPKGHESVATDYCDECGTPMGAQPSAAPASAPPGAAAPASGETCPSCGSARDGRFCEVCGHDFVLGDPQPDTVADPAYHTRMRELAAPDAPPIPFPAYCPERRFPVRTTQLLIGRRRPSRGIEPDIDLTGPPEDAAVSHSHALLVAGPDGDLSVVDLASANGTYVNESTEPIEPHVPVPLKEGDRIHVGAWTTLTVHREETA